MFKNPPPAPSKGGISISLRGMFIGGLFFSKRSKRYVIFKIETRSSLPVSPFGGGLRGRTFQNSCSKILPCPSKGGISIALRGIFIGGLFFSKRSKCYVIFKIETRSSLPVSPFGGGLRGRTFQNRKQNYFSTKNYNSLLTI